MYHAVENAERPPRYKHFYVCRDEFAWQMRWMRRKGYQPIGFDHLADAMNGSKKLPSKPVILTFDDGYSNLLTNVCPIMREYAWPYTVFLVSERIGRTNEWVITEGYEATPLLTWDDIRAMAAESLVDFQPHTATHPHLSRLDPPQLQHELHAARDLLEDGLQKRMCVLCYPYGDFNADITAAARRCGYAMAVTTQFGRVRRGDDPMALPRISVYHVPPVSLTYGIGTLNFGWRLRTRKDTRRE